MTTLSEPNSIFNSPVRSKRLSLLGIRTMLERHLRNQLVGYPSNSQKRATESRCPSSGGLQKGTPSLQLPLLHRDLGSVSFTAVWKGSGPRNRQLQRSRSPGSVSHTERSGQRQEKERLCTLLVRSRRCIQQEFR